MLKIKIYWSRLAPHAAGAICFRALERLPEGVRSKIGVGNGYIYSFELDAIDRQEFVTEVTDAEAALCLREAVSKDLWCWYGFREPVSLEFIDRADLNFLLCKADELSDQLYESKARFQTRVFCLTATIKQAVSGLKKTRRLFGSKDIAEVRRNLEAAVL